MHPYRHLKKHLKKNKIWRSFRMGFFLTSGKAAAWLWIPSIAVAILPVGLYVSGWADEGRSKELNVLWDKYLKAESSLRHVESNVQNRVWGKHRVALQECNDAWQKKLLEQTRAGLAKEEVCRDTAYFTWAVKKTEIGGVFQCPHISHQIKAGSNGYIVCSYKD